MARIFLFLMLLALPAMGQTEHSWNWVATNLGWLHRLQDGKKWTGYFVGKNSNGTYTIYHGDTPLAQGSDLDTMKRQAEATAQ